MLQASLICFNLRCLICVGVGEILMNIQTRSFCLIHSLHDFPKSFHRFSGINQTCLQKQTYLTTCQALTERKTEVKVDRPIIPQCKIQDNVNEENNLTRKVFPAEISYRFIVRNSLNSLNI
ncbi:CLUMA_CG008212, isoform A [Clunio marinus]|uniref:CLUMA_CG008212, isoform A n=1 Tax=Clunio marinus TaxID=568069 RepID=A0A1J1I327_9DIPT|nr:CLUMA_CG008212, isoform A [Clunio marinus]